MFVFMPFREGDIMRFDEYFDEQYPGKTFTDIHHTPFFICARNWLETLSGWSVWKDTRKKLVQETLDLVYTSLEKKLNSTSMSQIMSDQHWQQLVHAITTVFPQETQVYYPTPVEQRRSYMLIRNSIATGILRDKLNLLKEFSKRDQIRAQNVSDYVLTRAKIQILASASQTIMGRYKGSQAQEWEYWHKIANRRRFVTQAGGNIAKTKPKNSSGISGKAQGYAYAACSTGRSFAKDNGGHFKARGSVNAMAQAGIHGEAEAEFDRDTKKVILHAGVEAEAGARVDGKLDVEYSFSIRDSDFRRIFGNRYNLASLHATGNATVGAGFDGSVNSNFVLGGMQTQQKNEQLNGPMPPKERIENKLKDKKRDGVHIGAEGKVWIGFTASANVGLTLGELVHLETSGDLMAGAVAQGHALFFIERNGFRMAAAGDAFAGFEAALEEKFSIKHPKRRIEVFSAKYRQGVTAGIGIGAEALAAGTSDEIHFLAGAQATAGLGTRVKSSVKFSPTALGLMGKDLAIVPAASVVRSILNSIPYVQGSTLANVVESRVNSMNSQSDREELQAFASETRAEIEGYLSELEAEADKIHKNSAAITGH